MAPLCLSNFKEQLLVKRLHTPIPLLISCKINAPTLDMQNFVKPLSDRQQQVLTYRNQDLCFEAIANHLGLSPTAARAYHRRALSKRQRTIVLASLEQGDSSALNDRKTPVQPEQALAESPQMCRVSCRSGDERSPHQRQSSVSESFASGVRLASALVSLCERKLRTESPPFHSPAADALALRERPNAIELCVPSLFVTGEPVTNRRSPISQNDNYRSPSLPPQTL